MVEVAMGDNSLTLEFECSEIVTITCRWNLILLCGLQLQANDVN